MLFLVGPLLCDTFPFEVSGAKRSTSADFAKHDLIGRRRGYEFSGPGDATLTLKGKLLPFHVGGLGELDLAHGLCEAGDPLYVFRGDGTVMGWFVLTGVDDDHKTISPVGIGFEVEHELKLERVDDPGPAAGAAQLATLLSLFG